MNDLKLGIIGAGAIAENIHIPALSQIAGVSIVAICDHINKKAENIADKYGIDRTYLSYHDMLKNEEIDAVFVLTQPDGLFRIAYDCLTSEKHVFMEKPMGITLFQARTLKKTADDAKRVLHVGYNRRYIPLVKKIIARMEDLTEITHVEGRFYKNSSPSFYQGCSSAFVCDVIHVIDLVRIISGGKIIKVATLESTEPITNIAYSWYSVIEFSNKKTGVIRSNYSTGGRVHQFEMHGPGASAYIDLGFGDSSCNGKILINSDKNSFSLSSAGIGSQKILDFNGIEIAGSDRYEKYYGYYDEDLLFIEDIRKHPFDTNPERSAEDLETMEALAVLLDSRI